MNESLAKQLHDLVSCSKLLIEGHNAWEFNKIHAKIEELTDRKSNKNNQKSTDKQNGKIPNE
jgi:hypothetical protein